MTPSGTLKGHRKLHLDVLHLFLLHMVTPLPRNLCMVDQINLELTVCGFFPQILWPTWNTAVLIIVNCCVKCATCIYLYRSATEYKWELTLNYTFGCPFCLYLQIQYSIFITPNIILSYAFDVKYLCQATAFAYILKEQKDCIKIKLILFEPATRKAQCAILYYTSF